MDEQVADGHVLRRHQQADRHLGLRDALGHQDAVQGAALRCTGGLGLGLGWKALGVVGGGWGWLGGGSPARGFSRRTRRLLPL